MRVWTTTWTATANGTVAPQTPHGSVDMVDRVLFGDRHQRCCPLHDTVSGCERVSEVADGVDAAAVRRDT